MYSTMIQCCWDTLRTFSQNDKQLQGIPGAIAVLHTHSRCLDFHPHVHMIMPAAAIDALNKLWRTKKNKPKVKNKIKTKSGLLSDNYPGRSATIILAGILIGFLALLF